MREDKYVERKQAQLRLCKLGPGVAIFEVIFIFEVVFFFCVVLIFEEDIWIFGVNFIFLVFF